MNDLKHFTKGLIATLLGTCLILSAAPAWAGDGGGGGRGADQEEIWQKREKIDDTVGDIGDELEPLPWDDPEIPDYDDMTPEEREETFEKWRRERARLNHTIRQQMAAGMMGL